MELLRYYKLSDNARCRRASSEHHHVDERSAPFILLKWSRCRHGHGQRRSSALPQEMAVDIVLRVRRRSCGLLNTGFSGQALLGSIAWDAVFRF
ncbi:hypothetical protein B0T09DRAFT_187626 [Sordaria sp. MPI-SDFR-AT-0083]|nr:hypothetical protein B0T09DRAFT_187626 [Sordaria sp. MPI-SDFR-AT-0083]